MRRRVEELLAKGSSRKFSITRIQCKKLHLVSTLYVEFRKKKVQSYFQNKQLLDNMKEPLTSLHTLTSLPKKWKTVTLNQYDGNTDSNEHVAINIAQVNLYSTHDVVMYKTFPTTLK